MKNKKGFTLIELLAVIAILAILIVISVPGILKLFTKSKENVFLQEAKTIFKTSITQFSSNTILGSSSNRTVYTDDNENLDISTNKGYYVDVDNGKVVAIEVFDNDYCISLYDDDGIEINSLSIDKIGENTNCNNAPRIPGSYIYYSGIVYVRYPDTDYSDGEDGTLGWLDSNYASVNLLVPKNYTYTEYDNTWPITVTGNTPKPVYTTTRIDLQYVYYSYMAHYKMIVIPETVTYISLRTTYYDFSELERIIFQGTKSQWSAIERADTFEGVTVVCTDGEVAYNYIIN